MKFLIMSINIDNEVYEVIHSFTPNRVIINYDGLFVLADQLIDGSWALSEKPASNNEEREILKELTEPMNDQSIVTIIKD